MKKLFLFVLLFVNGLIYSQFLPSGTSTSTNIYRLGSLGIGYSSTPTFGTNKLLINGGSLFNGNINLFNGNLMLGTNSSAISNHFDFGIRSEKPFIISNNLYPVIDIRTNNDFSHFGFTQIAIATGDAFFSNVSKKGDVVYRAQAENFIITNERDMGNIKFVTKNSTLHWSSQVRMFIDKSGNVGIGTETPDARLAVNGLIHAKEVLVDLVGWPDYVFENKYKLKTLEEVENFIEINGHLPSVPSAAEVEEYGVNLGEMNKILLEKVEELTLYMIQMDKELKSLREELKKS